MNKKLTLAVVCWAVAGLYAPAEAASATMHKHQTDLWYNNNFGASAKEVFGVLEPETMKDDAYHVGLGHQDIDLLLAGRIRQEGFIFNKATTLREDYNDLYGFTRSKLNLDIRTQYGRRHYGKPAAQMHTRLTSFSVWDAANEYTPVLDQEVYFNGSNFIKRAEIGKHNHRGSVPLLFLDQGWIRVNFDTFMGQLDNDVALQVGHFPYIVGRGISLGDYPFTGVEFLGWEREGDIGNVTQAPVGVLLHFGVGKDNQGAVEFYYSQSRKRSHAPDWTREEVRAKRLDLAETDDPKDIQRGTANDQSIYALRGNWNIGLGKDKKHKLYVEPYVVYTKAPELKVEFDADASARLCTFGGMAEYSHGNWSVNAEIAGQVGHHQMHSIDRNHLVVDDSYYLENTTSYDEANPDATYIGGRLDEKMGMPTKYQSHVLLGVRKIDSTSANDVEYMPYRAYYVSDETKHLNSTINRGMHAQGASIKVGDNTEGTIKPGTDPVQAWAPGELYRSTKFDYSTAGIGRGGMYGAYVFKTGIDYFDTKFAALGTKPDGTLFNANIPFGGMTRFRPGYKLSCKSVMAMLDVAYTLPNKRAKFAAAAGYVGGDKYPFNQEVDKDYNGFIPMRDGNYVGRWVTSFVMLYPRKLPRPTEMADKDFYAHKNYQTMQNLQYLGLSAKWYPSAILDTVSCEVNGLYFWQVAPPHKWSTFAKRTFNNSNSEGGFGKEDSQYQYIQDEELHFKGAATDEWASKKLGAEINFVLKWQPFSNCEFVCRGGAFFPGQLYDDIQGCPSINTRRVDKDGNQRYDSLGSKVVTGGMLRATYKF